MSDILVYFTSNRCLYTHTLRHVTTRSSPLALPAGVFLPRMRQGAWLSLLGFLLLEARVTALTYVTTSFFLGAMSFNRKALDRKKSALNRKHNDLLKSKIPNAALNRKNYAALNRKTEVQH